MSNQTMVFDRHEINWLYRRIKAARDRAVMIIQKYSLTSAQVSETEQEELKAARENNQFLHDQVQQMENLLEDGLRRMGALTIRREELKDNLTLCDEQHVKDRIQNELEALAYEEEYRITMDRQTLKFVAKLVEKQISDIKTKLIPHYTNASTEHFENAENPMSRSYYINKHTRTKVMLEKLQVRIEKRL